MRVAAQKIPSLINDCGCFFPRSGRHFDDIVIAEFDRSEISPLLTVLYLAFLLQTKARWTLIRLVCLVRAQIDILHGDESVCRGGRSTLGRHGDRFIRTHFCDVIVKLGTVAQDFTPKHRQTVRSGISSFT